MALYPFLGEDVSVRFYDIILHELLQKDKVFRKTYRDIASCTAGKRWLIGSYIHHTLISWLQVREKPPIKDIDFLVEEYTGAPRGWEEARNRMGGIKLKKDGCTVDVVVLRELRYIVNNRLEPTVENFLAGAPLSLQSLAYDMERRKLVGREGTVSLVFGMVGINNPEEAALCASIKGDADAGAYLRRYAKEAGLVSLPEKMEWDL